MGLFDFFKLPAAPAYVPPPRMPGSLPVANVDLNKRYDIYCTVAYEERVYENVRIVGARTYEQLFENAAGLYAGYLEIETLGGATMLIMHNTIQVICEHGTKPEFTVLKTWAPSWQR